jgi:enterochelin esterase-like enzyme
MDENTIGHPLPALRDLPPGKYTVQAVLNVYETVRRADGHTLKVPDRRRRRTAVEPFPGKLVQQAGDCRYRRRFCGDTRDDEVIPPLPPPADTKYVRHVRIQSDMLTKFWGVPVHLGAIVVVPEGFDENPTQKYPVAYNQGHFPRTFRGFNEKPPPASVQGGARQQWESAHRFYQDWTSGRLPKMLLVLTQHATPYYDDSYGVNSANMGPYGDALTQELYPHIEKKFRAIGEPWARVLFGGSTGGWISLAQQILYPEYFGGAWGFCPDPVDFHAFQTIDVYSDKNAYYDIGPFKRLPKLLGRTPNDRVLATMEDFSRQELVLGARSRSGGQMDAFHATFGPVGPDGYPARLWDPITGAIDPEVARHWREKYDLTAILQNNWERLGPRLVGKIHVKMGTKDTFFLDAATRRMEQFLESTKLPNKGPYYGGTFEYGPDKPHCWSGNIPAGLSPTSHYLPIFAEHMRKMAPKDADVRELVAIAASLDRRARAVHPMNIGLLCARTI